MSGTILNFPFNSLNLFAIHYKPEWFSLSGSKRINKLQGVWSSPGIQKPIRHFIQYIKLLIQQAGLGNEWVREPRLPIAGEDRARVLEIIRKSFAKRPKAAGKTKSTSKSSSTARR